MNERSLKEKTIKGVGWSAADSFLGRGITFIIGIVLARILSPAEYGLIGICLIFTTVLNSIVDSGFSTALIRKQDVTDKDYNTMFVTNLIISITLYIILYLASPYISIFFARKELLSLVRVMGVILIINALSIIQVTVLTKKIDFKTNTKASLVSAILSGIVGISMAYFGFGVWALVIQQITKQLFCTIILWFSNKWIPNFSFSKNSFKYMWGYGWKLLLSGLLNNIWNQLYQVVVGKFYNPSTLGQYVRSSQYAGIFSENITSIVQRVSFPVLSGLQNDREKMFLAYRKVIMTTMYVTSICMIWLGAISEPLIYCLIGPKWHEAAVFLPLICINMSLYPLHAINLNVLAVQGRTDIFLYLEIIKKIIGILPVVIGILFSIYWMLIAGIVTGFISFFLNSYYTGKFLHYPSWMQLRDILPGYGVAILVAICVYFFKFIPISYWLILPLQIIIGALILLCVSEYFKLSGYIEIRGIFLKGYFKLKK